MDKPKHKISWLIIGVCGLSILGWCINALPPTNAFALILFFSVIAITVFSFSLFIFKIVRRATIITLGVIVWLMLRFFGLREPLYSILLVPVLIALEILFRTK